MKHMVKILAVLLALATLSATLSLAVEAREAVAHGAGLVSTGTATTDTPAQWSRGGSLVVRAESTTSSPGGQTDTGSVPLLSEAGWTTIVSEDFEGSASLAGWEVEDGNGPISGEHYWAKRNCRAYGGSYSGWAVGGGADGAALGCGSNYPNGAASAMVYGPFSLVDTMAAELRFRLWLDSEYDYDDVFWGASTNGAQFYGQSTTGNTAGWEEKVLDLTGVPFLGDLTGEPSVWIVLLFVSDPSITRPEGAYVDDILLRAYADTLDRPDVGIVKRVLGSDLKPGDRITFTLDIANTGALAAHSVVVADTLPPEVLAPTYTSTLPITPTGTGTYTWDVGELGAGQSGVITVCGQIDPGLPDIFSFQNTATISDPGDSSPGNNSSQVMVQGGAHKVFLPSIMRYHPPIPDAPVLNAISNGDGDGDYEVTWTLAYLADTYTLQEDDNPSFSSPTTVYDHGTSTSWSATDRLGGTYYYRVKATNDWGDSGWSNTRSVKVFTAFFVDADADADVIQGFPAVNTGNDSEMWVGYDNSTCHPGTPSGQIGRSLMYFDLSWLPPGERIAKARLHFRVVGACWVDATGASRTITAHRVKKSWSEASVTWNSQPGYGESYGSASIPLGDSLGWYSLDVTNLVRGWENGSISNRGLVLIGPEGTSNGRVRFSIATREWSPYAPYLSIEYDEMAVQDDTSAAGRTPLPTECMVFGDGTVVCSPMGSLDRSRRRLYDRW